MLHAVIMAGGSGTRFWPLSRTAFPKQFLTLHGEASLLRQAYDRIASMVGPDRVLVITNAQHVAATRNQLPEVPTSQAIGEPFGRDTAACIGLGAAILARRDPDAIMVVLAADHLIRPTSAFHQAVAAAAEFVNENPDALMTFGITPTQASTAYGYLRRGDVAKHVDGVTVHRLLSFHEKPDLKTAKQFLESGEYYWNSGIFCWRASTMLEELRQRQPKIADAVARIADAWDTPQRDAVFKAEYEPLVKISIDYAVMEHSNSVHMVDATFQWDDVGSWLALERVLGPDEAGNVVLGRHVGLNTNGCVIVGDSNHLVTTLGAKNLIVVHTPDATLVADRNDEQAVKQLLAELENKGWRECL